MELPILGNIDLANRCNLYTVFMFQCAVREYLPEVFYYNRTKDSIDNQMIAEYFLTQFLRSSKKRDAVDVRPHYFTKKRDG